MASKRKIRRRSCDCKQKYKTSKDAAKAAYYSSKRGNVINSWAIRWYKCKFCKGFHIGRSPGGLNGSQCHGAIKKRVKK